MADFTDFDWTTGDWGEAYKYNSMVDNDRYLRGRTDFKEVPFAHAGFPPEFLLLRIGGVDIGQLNVEASLQTYRVLNLSLEGVQPGPLDIDIVWCIANWDERALYLRFPIVKTADLNFASLWITPTAEQFISEGGQTDYRYWTSGCVILHREETNW